MVDKRSILVVEDDPIIREVMCLTLADAEFEVMQAESAPEAIALLEGGSVIDAAFLDVDLGDRSGGFEVARRAREMRPGIEIIYTSGGAQERFAQERVDRGIFVPKPYRPSRVCSLICTVLAPQKL